MPTMIDPVELFVGLRYLRAKRRTRFVSFITSISLAGIALGVAALIVILSVMNGFEGELRDLADFLDCAGDSLAAGPLALGRQLHLVAEVSHVLGGVRQPLAGSLLLRCCSRDLLDAGREPIHLVRHLLGLNDLGRGALRDGLDPSARLAGPIVDLLEGSACIARSRTQSIRRRPTPVGSTVPAPSSRPNSRTTRSIRYRVGTSPAITEIRSASISCPRLSRRSGWLA